MGWKQLEHERFLMSLSQLYSTACQHSQMCINDGCGMWRKSCDSSRPSSSTSSEDEMWTKDNVLLKKMQGVDPKLYFWLLLYSQMVLLQRPTMLVLLTFVEEELLTRSEDSDWSLHPHIVAGEGSSFLVWWGEGADQHRGPPLALHRLFFLV